MPKYLLALRDRVVEGAPPADADLQRIIGRFADWKDALVSAGTLHGGEKLVDGEGAVVRKESSQVTTSARPYEASSELLSGFFIVEAESLAEASRVAAGCPQVDFGSVEVREIEQF